MRLVDALVGELHLLDGSLSGKDNKRKYYKISIPS